MSPDEIAAARRRLCDAGAALRRRPASRTLDALVRVVDGWCDPASPWRARLERELPAATGFTAPVVAEGLARGLEPWSGAALRDVARSELEAVVRPGTPTLVAGFDLTSVLLAGAIPTPTLLALLLPLVIHSPVLARTSARDPLTARLVADSIHEMDSQLGDCVEVVSFPSDDLACSNELLRADCVVASGSDETIAAIRGRLRPSQRLVAYGHRCSLAVLGPGATRDTSLADVADRLALDTALWDQLGCLSPVAVYVVDPEAGSAERVAGALAGALGALEKDLPRGEIETAAAAAIARERAEAEMRGAAVHRSEGTQWSVVLEADAGWRPAPLHRFLHVHPVADTGALFEAIAPLAPHLAAVALEGFGDDDALAQTLAIFGASRVCRAGCMQAPPLGWHHDGQPLLLPLARIGDLET